MDMLRSMISHSNIPVTLWNEVLKTTIYILNKVPSKPILKTAFELWKRWKPSLNHIHIWGCQIKVKIYNPNLKN